MYRLRSTAKLLARLNVAPERDPVESDTRLGDWYANIVHVGRTPLVLAVSDRTLLPVVLRARELNQIVPRLAERVGEVLRAIGAPADAVDREVEAMRDAAICRTASRRVLGSMTDFALMMDAWLDQHADRDDDSLVAMSVWLAETPCSPIGMDCLRDVTLAVLRGDDVAGVE